MKQLLAAILSGILLAFSWPTYGFPFLMFVSFIPLLWAEREIRNDFKPGKGWRVIFISYTSFVIWNFVTTSWLYYASAFGMWFAVLVNSLLMTLVFFAYHRFAKRVPQSRAFTFLVCLWIGFEYLHLHWDFSWPWLQLGNGFSEYTGAVQWYEYTGVFGGSLWVWVFNVLLFWIFFEKQNYKQLHVWILPAALLSIPLSISGLLKRDIDDSKASDEVVIIQPNIDPYTEKYQLSNYQIVQDLKKSALPYVNKNTTFVIAPETVLANNLPYSTLQYHSIPQQLRSINATYPNAYFLGGAALIDFFGTDSPKRTSQSNRYDGARYYNDYNSALFIPSSGPIQVYHKSKLVVGIENFPYKSVLQPLLGNAMIDLGGTVATKTTQEERSVFTTKDDKKIAPIICYESVYGDYVTDYVMNGAQYLAIITNDAWWGNTQGHKQHLSLARLRAIENRRWVARSANTGISAIIDLNGDLVASLGYEEKGVLTGALQANDELTFYSKHGDYIGRIAMFVGVFVLLFGIVKRSSKKRGRHIQVS